MNETPKLLVNAREAARLLSISPRSVFTMTKDGRLPHVRLGRSVRYAVDELRLWVAENGSGANP